MSIDTQTENVIDLNLPPHLRVMTGGEVSIRLAYLEMYLAMEKTATLAEVDAVADNFKTFLDGMKANNGQAGLDDYLAQAKRRLHHDVKYRKTYLNSLNH